MSKKKNFKKLFFETKKLARKHNARVSDHLAKLMEESGEFATSINKLTGLKGWSKEDTPRSIVDNLVEEGADQIQIIVGLLGTVKVKPKKLLKCWANKNKKYSKFIKKKNP